MAYTLTTAELPFFRRPLKCLLMISVSISLATTCQAETVKQDRETLMDMFHKVESPDGPDAIQCHDQKRLAYFFDTLNFMEKSFRALHNNFPEFDPPLEDQLRSRIDLSCQVFDCKAPISPEKCAPTIVDGKDTRLWQYEFNLDKVKKRLKKAGLDPDNPKRKSALTTSTSTPVSECPNSAKYYQDAYIRDLRADDLICYNKALRRSVR